MSGVYLVMCQSCSYSQGFKFGVGNKFSNLNQAVCLVNANMRYQVQEIIRDNGLSETDFGYRAFHCPICNNLCDEFWVRIEQDSTSVFETEVYCSKCGNRMQSVLKPEDMKAFPCPDCYNVNLDLVRVMPWD